MGSAQSSASQLPEEKIVKIDEIRVGDVYQVVNNDGSTGKTDTVRSCGVCLHLNAKRFRR